VSPDNGKVVPLRPVDVGLSADVVALTCGQLLSYHLQGPEGPLPIIDGQQRELIRNVLERALERMQAAVE
jgi:hypothetical protein